MTSAAVSGLEVWDRLWRSPRDVVRDAGLIEAEQRGARWALVSEWLASTFGGLTGLRAIELGCGRGDLSVLLALQGARVTLLDYSDAALAQARERFTRLELDAEFVRGDLLGDLDRFAGCFDVTCSLGVIEHFRGPDRYRAVVAHRRALRRGGVAIISVPYALGLPYRLWKLCLEVRGWWPYGMEMPYGKRELRRLAGRAGFGHTEMEATGFWQSIADQWGRALFGSAPDWSARRSCLDSLIGGTLTMLAWNGPAGTRTSTHTAGHAKISGPRSGGTVHAACPGPA